MAPADELLNLPHMERATLAKFAIAKVKEAVLAFTGAVRSDPSMGTGLAAGRREVRLLASSSRFSPVRVAAGSLENIASFHHVETELTGGSR